MKILAVIVTFNKEVLLSRCLDYVLKQKRKPDEILVINNGSTDDTESVLVERNILHINQNNVGGAGGFQRGLEYALEKEFDAVWLMDDDGFPEENSLDILEKSLNSDIVCASAVVLQVENPENFVFQFTLLDSKGFPKIFGFPRKFSKLHKLKSYVKSNSYPFAYFFNGALICSKTIKQIGGIDCSLFIYGDEVDYFFRLRSMGSVITVFDAIHFHPDVSNRPLNINMLYFLIRNSIIVHRRYFNFVILRNLLTISVILYRVLKRNSFKDFISLLIGYNSKLFFRAIQDGINNNLSFKIIR
jgi:GT2 family glycosyltransferase